jgi:hypothetical protein
MKAILCFLAIGTVILLGSVSFTAGQGSPQPMFITPIVEDHLCNSVHNFCHVNDLTDCQMVLFWGSGGVPAHIKVTITCTTTPSLCGDCIACSYVRRASDHGLVAEAFTNCNGPCSAVSIPDFTMDMVQYELWVCLRSCSGDCRDCSADCYAHAEVQPN